MDVRFLRSLCRRVTPASLRVGSKEARRHTFLVGVTRKSGNLVLALGPVPSCPPGPTRAVVDFSDGGRRALRRWSAHPGGRRRRGADGGVGARQAPLPIGAADAARRRRLRDLHRRGRGRRAAVLPDPGHRRARAPRRDQRAARARHGARGSHRALPARGPPQRRGGGHQLLARRSTRTDGSSTNVASATEAPAGRRIETRGQRARRDRRHLPRARHPLGALRSRVRGHGLGTDRRGQRADAAADGDRSRPGARAALPGQRRRSPPHPVGRRDRRVLAVRQRLSFLRADHRRARATSSRSRRRPSCANGTAGARSERRSARRAAPSSATATR